MFKIGLDLSIYARLKNKKTGKETVLELAYWRKAYAIRDMLVDVAMNNKIDDEDNCEDVEICCSPQSLYPILTNLISALGETYSSYWVNSCFDIADTRANTLRNIGSLLTFKDWLTGDCDACSMYESCYDVKGSSSSDFTDFETADDFEVVLEIINSY